MPRLFAQMSPQARAAFIDEQIKALQARVNDPNPESASATTESSQKHNEAQGEASTVAKKPARRPSVARAARAPRFIQQQPPEIARHRRKCAICHHPDREVIEDLFIHWHSPESIASHFDDDEETVTWVSIYRHAYALGLDEVRRRNLRFVFEHILDQAGTIVATPAAVIAAARALASCVNEAGQWNEPPKRVVVTNVVKNDNAKGEDAPRQAESAGAILAPSAKGGITDAEEPSSHPRTGDGESALPAAPSRVDSGDFVGAPSAKGGIADEYVPDSASVDEIRITPNFLITNGS